MKCKVCGAESGKYPLCRACNAKKEKNEIIKCEKCGNWHYINLPCPVQTPVANTGVFLYEVRKTLISKSEQNYYNAIVGSIPEGYSVFPQINLASFINRTDDARFHNELFRNVDFLITDVNYKPKIIVEINDQTHLNNERKERDEKVKKICEEAGIPILKLWTSYGVNADYIKNRIDELLKMPVTRVHHFSQTPAPTPPITPTVQPTTPVVSQQKKKGCYIATCVYGSYDCPEVWMLRRYRDNILDRTWYGRLFIKTYYAISPTLVKWFGGSQWFRKFWKGNLDYIVFKLHKNGIEFTPYEDK